MCRNLKYPKGKALPWLHRPASFLFRHLPAQFLSLGTWELPSLLYSSPIGPQTLSLPSQVMPVFLMPGPSCGNTASLPFVFPPCGCGLKCRSDHAVSHFKRLAVSLLPREDRNPHSQPPGLFTVWPQSNFSAPIGLLTILGINDVYSHLHGFEHIHSPNSA